VIVAFLEGRLSSLCGEEDRQVPVDLGVRVRKHCAQVMNMRWAYQADDSGKLESVRFEWRRSR
jgi:hypothetical protein